jgi:hypothetical protein
MSSWRQKPEENGLLNHRLGIRFHGFVERWSLSGLLWRYDEINRGFSGKR